jgi:hypothetical protein
VNREVNSACDRPRCEHCAASHKTKTADGDNYCVGWVRNSPVLARKKERSAPIAYQSVLHPEKTKLLLRSRCSLCFWCRRSLWCFTCFSTRFTSCSTRFYTRATTRLLRWGWGCGLGSGSLRRARRRCRISCEKAGISDKAENRS